MGVGAGLSMYVVVVQKFTFAISSPDEFLSHSGANTDTCHGGIIHHRDLALWAKSALDNRLVIQSIFSDV